MKYKKQFENEVNLYTPDGYRLTGEAIHSMYVEWLEAKAKDAIMNKGWQLLLKPA